MLGPLLIGHIHEPTAHYFEALHIIPVIVLVSSVMPLIARPPAALRVESFAPPKPRPSRT